MFEDERDENFDYSYSADQSDFADQSFGSDSRERQRERQKLANNSLKSGAEQYDESRGNLLNRENKSLDHKKYDSPMNYNGDSGSTGGSATKWFATKKFKYSLAGGLTAIVMGGGMFAGFSVISGPMQVVQMMNFIKEHYLDIFDDVFSRRGLRNTFNLKNFAELKAKNLKDRIQASRVGNLGNFVADRQMKRMSNMGLDINSDVAGNYRGISIDPSKMDPNVDFDKMDDAAKKNWAKNKTGLDLDFKNGRFEIPDNMSYRDTKKFINKMNGFGRWNFIGKLQTRTTLKKVGKLSNFHFIQKKKTEALKKLADWMEDAAKKIRSGDGTPEGARKKAEDEKTKELCEGKGADCIKNNKSEIEKAGADAESKFKADFDASKDYIDANGNRGVSKFTSQLSSKIASLGKTPPGIGFVRALVTISCMINDISDTLGMYQMENIVNVAQGLTAATIGTGSQIMSGDDIDLWQVGNFVKAYMGSEQQVYEIDENGNQVATGETEFSNAWNAPAINAELREPGGEQGDNDGVPSSLKMVGTSKFTGTGGGVLLAMTSIIGNGITCWFDDFASSIGEGLTDWLMKPLMAAVGLDKIMSDLMATIMGWLASDPLNIEKILPEQAGSVIAYGAMYMLNEKARANGGRRLKKAEATALRRENLHYLAEKHREKPLLARVFDPTDYNSTISQIARAVNANTSSQDFGTQFGNVAKFFASAPSLLINATAKMSGVSAASSYDYGVPMYGYSLDEIEKITGGESQYDIVENTGKVIGNNDASEGVLHDDNQHGRLKALAGVDYSDSDGSLNNIENTDSEAGEGDKTGLWSYIGDNPDAPQYTHYAWEVNSDKDLAIRTYLMDYNIINGSACMEGGADDSEASAACDYVGIDAGGGGTNSIAGVGTPDNVEDLGGGKWKPKANTDYSNVACAPGTKDSNETIFQEPSGSKFRLCSIPGNEGTDQRVSSLISGNLLKMFQDAKAAGHNFIINSGFRSSAEQDALYKAYLRGEGNLAAEPGTSMHEWGTAVDIGGVCPFDSSAWNWMKQNGPKYGFFNDESWTREENAKECWHFSSNGG